MKNSMLLLAMLAIASTGFTQRIMETKNQADQLAYWKKKQKNLGATSLVLAGLGGVLIYAGINADKNSSTNTSDGSFDMELFTAGELMAFVGTGLAITSIPIAARALWYHHKIRKAKLSINTTAAPTLQTGGGLTYNNQAGITLSFPLGK